MALRRSQIVREQPKAQRYRGLEAIRDAADRLITFRMVIILRDEKKVILDFLKWPIRSEATL